MRIGGILGVAAEELSFIAGVSGEISWWLRSFEKTATTDPAIPAAHSQNSLNSHNKL
jgi:hypothetical protein